MGTIGACLILRRHGLPTSLLGIARRSGHDIPLAIAAVDVSGHRTDAGMATYLAMMGDPDDYIRARAATWNQRLRDAIMDECE